MSKTVKDAASALEERISKVPPVSTECCIYRVPDKFRKVNEEAYTPRFISIGPFHRARTELQPREEVKLRYLKGFLRRTNTDLVSCARRISELEERIRQYYQEPLVLTSNELVEMIVVDAAFLVELFIRNHFPNLRDENDEIFSKQWMSNDVLHDVLLLENQIPFFVLENLYELTKLQTTITFFKLSYEYFKDVLHGHQLTHSRVPVGHLVDYVRGTQLPSFPRGVTTSKEAKVVELTRTAKEMQEAGVNFKRGEGSCSVLDITFRDGTLEVPRVVVHEWTETYFRNMIAYEQCHHDYKYISSYVILMDSLIDTPEDVDILVDRGILENQLGSGEDVAKLFNSMYKETIRESSKFYFSSLCENLNAYSRTRWHQWKAAFYRWKVILRREYFSNPWSTISVVAAIFLIALTLVQTACSMMDSYVSDATLFRRGRRHT